VAQSVWLSTAIFIAIGVAAARGADYPTGAQPKTQEELETIDPAPEILWSSTGEPKISWRKMFPLPKDQQPQQACTAFATAYAFQTYLWRKKNGWKNQDTDHIFSPAYIFSEISNERSQPIKVEAALINLVGGGCCTWNTMKFDPAKFEKKIPPKAKKEAERYKMIQHWDPGDIGDVAAVRNYLAAQKPLVIVAFVDVADGKWPKNNKGVTDHYLTDPPKPKQAGQERANAHTMVVVGYDEVKKAFEVMNSWGPT